MQVKYFMATHFSATKFGTRAFKNKLGAAIGAVSDGIMPSTGMHKARGRYVLGWAIVPRGCFDNDDENGSRGVYNMHATINNIFDHVVSNSILEINAKLLDVVRVRVVTDTDKVEYIPRGTEGADGAGAANGEVSVEHPAMGEFGLFVKQDVAAGALTMPYHGAVSHTGMRKCKEFDKYRSQFYEFSSTAIEGFDPCFWGTDDSYPNPEDIHALEVDAQHARVLNFPHVPVALTNGKIQWDEVVSLTRLQKQLK